MRDDAVAERDLAVAEDVRAETGAVDERADDPRPREPLEVGARLGQPASDAFSRPDGEAPADERVQRDAARDDVPARLLPRQVDFLERLLLDERQLVPATAAAEGSPAVEVAVALEPAAGDGADGVDRDERLLRVRPESRPTTEPEVEPPPYGSSVGSPRSSRATSQPSSIVPPRARAPADRGARRTASRT